MLEFSLSLFDLKKDFTLEDLEKAYKKVDKEEYKIYEEAYLFLKSYLAKKEDDLKANQEIKFLADDIINDYENNKLVIIQQIKNVFEFINVQNRQLYLNNLKSLLRNASFDFQKNPQQTIELWSLYSKYKDASDYNRNIYKK